ncbi:hypothetical protein TNCV_3776421 [Trichonephila clavipes]|nr:hypothetical protein TNCV_3776421 [Trichonephila clavipes]
MFILLPTILLKRIANDPFSAGSVFTKSSVPTPSTARLPGEFSQKVRNVLQRRCQACQTTSGRSFEHLL